MNIYPTGCGAPAAGVIFGGVVLNYRLFERPFPALHRMNSPRLIALLGTFSLCPFGAQAQATAPVDYEAEALRYFLATLLPRDHPTYRKLSYSGQVLPDIFTDFPCLTTYDSLKRDYEAGAYRYRAQSTGKAVPIPTSSAFKVVKRSGGRKMPWMGLQDAFEWRTRHVVPITLSLQYHYTDTYYVVLNNAGQVISTCRKQTIQ